MNNWEILFSFLKVASMHAFVCLIFVPSLSLFFSHSLFFSSSFFKPLFNFHLWIHLFLLNTDLTFSLPDTFDCISHTQCIHNHTLAKLAWISWLIVVLESEQKCVTKLTWTEVCFMENKETLCQEQKTNKRAKRVESKR